MPGLGTIINVAAIVAGGLLGLVFGGAMSERLQDGLGKACGVCVLFIGNGGDRTFVEGFVTASITVCVGAMAVVGAVQDGAFGDWSILATKAVLDFVIILVMTCSLGKGCAFSALPVGVFQGCITVLAAFIGPLMTDSSLAGLSLVGSILIFCVGVNLVWGPKVKVANMLPAIVVAPLLMLLPIAW